MPSPRCSAVFLLLAMALSACAKDDIQVYRLAKPGESRSPLARSLADPGAGQGPSGNPAADAPGLSWKAPPGWKEEPGSGMRAASFRVSGTGGSAELSVVVLPGEAGGLLANVNRWRGQIGLAPWSESELESSARSLASPAGRLTLVDFAKGSRVLAAVLPAGGRTWFFKLTGPDPVVTAARGEFLAFLKSLKPAHGKGS